MYAELERRMARLTEDADPALLTGRRVGLEKESLRVDKRGGIARTDHPAALGAALSHPSITTDFSEALIEMVTPPLAGPAQALSHLEGTHRFVAARLEQGEMLWNASMPCMLYGDEGIRIGEYGNSFTGRMKHIYRRGLGLRYGRRMQAIAGIHFNFSLPETAWEWRLDAAGPLRDTSAGYFSMMQNLIGISWLVPYLFGASSAICRSFLGDDAKTELESLGEATLFEPYGTSLRMGNIGYRYREDSKIDLSVDHHNLEAWIADVLGHVTQSHPDYAELGNFDADGHRQQLNCNRLQIENEYYGTVRPKQIPEPGQMPLLALADRGIRYLELRSVDIDVFEPAGLSLETVAFLEMLMMFAWLAEPHPIDDKDMQRTKDNLAQVAHRGRKPGLALKGPQGDIALETWARAILDSLHPLASWLDRDSNDDLYTRALTLQCSRLDDPAQLPSARVLAGVREAGSFGEFTQQLSREHHHTLLATPPPADQERALADAVVESLATRARLEHETANGDFEAMLAEWSQQLDAHRHIKNPAAS